MMVAGSNTWADAPTIPYGSDSAPTPSAGLTVEAGETFPNGWGLNRSAWWRLTAPASEIVGIEMFDSTWPDGDLPDAVVSVYTGPSDATSVTDLTRIAFNDDNDRDISRPGSDLLPELDFPATAGTTYWIQVALWSSSVDMTYVLRVGRRIETVTDWITDPTYQVEQNRDHLYHSLPTVLSTFESSEYREDGPVNIDAGPFIGAALATLPDGLPNSELNTSPYGVRVAWGWTTLPGTDIQATAARLLHHLHLRLLSPYNLTFHYPDSGQPTSAVGWEWESAPGELTQAPDHATPVGVVLLADSTLRSSLQDSSNDPTSDLTGDFETELHATRIGATAFWSDDPDGTSWPVGYHDRIVDWSPDYVADDIVGIFESEVGETQQVGEDIDLTPYMDGGRVAVYTRTRTQILPVDRMPDSETGNAGDEMTYGWALWDHKVRWTMAPQRYRWRLRTIALAGVPIQQTSHRDDHLAGGAYQTWPTPTSVQESNTTFGGYL